MNLAIVRTANGPLDINGYNVQEIGLAKGLIKSGFNVDIYSTFKDVGEERIFLEFRNLRIKLIPIVGFAFKQITYYPGLLNAIFKNDYDVVQIHDDSQLMGPYIAAQAKKRGIKTVLYQGMYTNYKGLGRVYQSVYDSLLKKKLQRNLDTIFAKTTMAKNYLERKGFLDISLLPVGLNFKAEQEYTDRDALNGFTSKFDKTLLYIGKLEPRRELSFVLNVFKDLIHINKKNIGFVIVGKGPDALKLRNLVNEFQLGDRVLFIEQVNNDEIGDVYKSCDVFVLPSHYEIYGMVVLEALYNGLPVISSKTAGPLDILNENYLGKLVNFNSKEWLTSLSDFFNSTYLTPEYSNRRKQHVLNNFNWETIAQTYILKL